MGETGSPTLAPIQARHWRLSDRKTARLLTVLLVGLAAMFGLTAGIGLAHTIYGDFFAMWTFARFALTHPAAGLYDRETLHAFQLTLDPAMNGYLPFPYPPFTILLLLPIGLLAMTPAWIIWSATGLAAYLAAAFAGPALRPRGDAILFVALAPATVMSLLSGQNGLFAAALMVGAVRLMGTRQIIAGVLFGLLSFKPQVALLVPVALAAAGLWRCFAAATLTIAALAAIATATFGLAIWANWVAALHDHWAGYVIDDNRLGLKMPTIVENLKLLGASPHAAQLCQLAAALIAASLVWLCFRRSAGVWATAALLVGNFIATPYALFYDLPPVTFAVVLIVSDMARTDQPWHVGELLILLFAFLMPFALMLTDQITMPTSGVALVLLFALIIRRGIKGKQAVLF
jgi:hypothetical protein